VRGRTTRNGEGGVLGLSEQQIIAEVSEGLDWGYREGSTFIKEDKSSKF